MIELFEEKEGGVPVSDTNVVSVLVPGGGRVKEEFDGGSETDALTLELPVLSTEVVRLVVAPPILEFDSTVHPEMLT